MCIDKARFSNDISDKCIVLPTRIGEALKFATDCIFDAQLPFNNLPPYRGPIERCQENMIPCMRTDFKLAPQGPNISRRKNRRPLTIVIRDVKSSAAIPFTQKFGNLQLQRVSVVPRRCKQKFFHRGS